MTEITGRNSEEEQRDRWLKLLRAGYMLGILGIYGDLVLRPGSMPEVER